MPYGEPPAILESHSTDDPDRTGYGLLILAAAVHVAAFWALFDDVGVVASIFGIGTVAVAAQRGATMGALLAAAWTTLVSTALVSVLTPASQNWTSLVLAPDHILGHLAMFTMAAILGRQRSLSLALRAQLQSLKTAESKLVQSEQQQAKAALRDGMRRADRMASVGTLAAGVAHEINNPLTYVIGNLYYALERLEDDDPQNDDLKQELERLLRDAADGAERVRRIVRDLKTFSRNPEEDDEHRIDIEAAIEAATNLVRNEIRHRATLEVELHDLPRIAGSESRLVQVLVNLLMNASQSITEGNAEAEHIRVVASLNPAGKVSISVTDSGCGMTDAVRAKVFDPFFTTKALGEGTGLGLSVTHGIIASMKGDISVTSEPGAGSTFIITLPVKTASRRSRRLTPPPAPSPTATGPRAPRRALIIDDEPKVAVSVGRHLTGFLTVIVNDGPHTVCESCVPWGGISDQL
jgi:signal transduction histidine kinase